MNRSQKVDSPLVLERVFDAPIELVWRAWTTRKEMAHWWVGGWEHLVHPALGKLAIFLAA